MYKLLLILRYLRRKVAPMFAALAVMLCTAMVIIVISVMGGFLRLMHTAMHAIEGDVTIGSDLTGFPHYQGLLDALRQLPEVEAGAAIIRSWGLVKMGPSVRTVEVVGIQPEDFAKVIDYGGMLHWRDPLLVQRGMNFQASDDPANRRGMVPGIAVSPYNQRDERGHYTVPVSLDAEMLLTILRVDRGGQPLEPAQLRLTVVNEFKSGLYEVDANRVFIDLHVLQKALRMDEYRGIDPETREPFVDPARVTDLILRGKPNVPLQTLNDAVRRRTIHFAVDHRDMPPLGTMTWMQRHATFLGAVQKEKMMLTFLFAIISVVAVAMIGVIFYMIVLEKTRDIGVLRALGASRSGIAGIFLGYGLAIGILGSALGMALAYIVVANINEIQDWLTQRFGFTMWDPKVYYFDRIPAQLDPLEVTVILIAAVIAGLLGALIPAWLASRLDPIEALRYE